MPLSPRTLRPANNFTPRSIPGLALWLDASSADTLYTTDAGPVTAVTDPLDITGCALWLDGADSSAESMTRDGSVLDAWKDKSGNGRDFTATSTARPTLTASAINSRSAVTFNGSTSTLTGNTAAQDVIRNLAGYTVFTVLRTATVAAGERLAFGVGATVLFRIGQQDSRPFMGGRRVSADTLESVTGTASDLSVGAAFIQTASVNHTSQSLTGLRNGATFASDATYMASGSSENVASSVSVGTQAGGTYGFWNGDIAEIVVFNTALSTADRARVEAYLATKWGISGVHVPATATSDPVGAWLDKSGNGRHLTQSLAASRPSFLPTGISSKPALNFDGTDDTIWRQPGLTSDDLSILIVHQTNTLSGGVTYEFTHQGDTTNAQASNLTGFGNVAGMQVTPAGSATYMCDVNRSFTQVDSQGRSGTAGDITANVPVIGTQCVSYSATASAIRKQAWTSGKGAPNSVRFNSGGWSAITLGARRNNLAAGGVTSPSVFLSGRIAEVIAYSRYISEADRRKLELYLARKWNVTLAGAPIVSNPDAQDWIDRVYGNGGSVSSTTAAAVNTLCQSITDAGIRDRFYRLNVFAGSNLNAALTPLYLGPTPLGIRYGNTTDTNNAFVGVGTDYAETGASGGLTGNGTSKYLDTGFPMNTLPSTTSGHAAVYCRNRSSSSSFHGMVGVNLAGGSGFGVATDGTVYAQWGAFANVTNNANGLLVASRTSATSLVAYAAGTAIATNSTSTTPTASTLNAAVFVSRNSTISNTFFDPRTYGFYSIGTGLSAAEVTSLTNAVNAFQAALGRA